MFALRIIWPKPIQWMHVHKKSELFQSFRGKHTPAWGDRATFFLTVTHVGNDPHQKPLAAADVASAISVYSPIDEHEWGDKNNNR